MKKYIVGGYFSEFINNKSVISANEFIEKLKHEVKSCNDEYIFGQGVDESEFDEIKELLLSAKLKIIPTFPDQKADKILTHKHKPHNGLISVPTKINDSTYNLQLLIDDKNDFMLDHLTGEHIQGMLLIEAARQSWTAVTEKFYLLQQEDTRFVLEEIKSNFSYFVFPLPVIIKLEVVKIDPIGSSRNFHVLVKFYQADREVASIEGKYKVIIKKIAEKQELLAKNLLFSTREAGA